MDHELMMGWLSVDPMADKYPNISPYAYCAWNPVKLVDPDGNDWYIPEGQNTPVFDKNVTANNCSQGATYVGETAHWFGQTKSDMDFYYHGDNEGNVTATDMTVNVDAKRVENISTERSWVGNLEYNIDEFFHKDFWTHDVATFEDKFEEKAQAVMTSLASAMPVVSQANSIHTLSKGEDMFGNKAETIDFVLSATGFIGSGLKFFKSKTLKKASLIVEIGSTGLSSIRSGRGIQKKRQDSRGGGK